MAERRALWATVFVLALAVLAAACGGGSNVRADLKRIALQPEDVPAGLSRGDDKYTTNEDLAAGNPDPEADLAKFQRWGRLLGYDVTYQPGPDTDIPYIGVTSAISLYRNGQGASESLAEGVADARKTDWKANHPGFGQLQVGEIDRPDLADEVLWLRISGFPERDPAEGVVIDDLILLRQGEVRAFVRAALRVPGNSDRQALLAEVEALARKQVERIRQVLGRDQ